MRDGWSSDADNTLRAQRKRQVDFMPYTRTEQEASRLSIDADMYDTWYDVLGIL